jgi:nucleotide-binding universal stress UspA family protein
MTSKNFSESGALNTVLVATDGSDYSAGAIRTGIALAQTHGAKLIGLSIALNNPEYSTLVPNLQEEAAKRAHEALASFNEATGGTAETATREAADPAQGIVAAADELGADLIVMGRRGKRGLARVMVGEATARVVGHASCPVLVAPRPAHLWEKHILLATDGSPYSEAAAGVAGLLAKQAGLPVSVVSVVTSSHSEERRKLAEQAVSAKVERLKSLGLQVEGRVVEGRPDEAIVKAAEAAGADLIVMGSHGRTGLKKILLGSVAERVIGHATCPVLIVKP